MGTAEAYGYAARRRIQLFTAVGIVLAVGIGASMDVSPLLPVALIAGIVAVVAICCSPKLGVMFLFFSAIVFESVQLSWSKFSDLSTELVQFFRPLQEFTSLTGVIFSPAEICMMVVAVAITIRAVVRRTTDQRRGRFKIGLFILLAWWLGEIVNGVATGGDPRIAILEIRTSLYMIVMYLLAYAALETREDFNALGWIIICGSGLKGIQGCFRYFITFHGDISSFVNGAMSILEHTEAFLFNCFLFYTLLLFLTDGPKLQKRVALFFLPFVMIANLVNHRRSSDAVTAIGLLVLVVVLYGVYSENRKRILACVGAIAVAFCIYTAAFWNSESLIAQPVRAIRSQFDPTDRDASSDAYRQSEDTNLMFTIQSSPILGFGFGKEFLRPTPMLDFRKNDPFIYFMPHNCILWIWMRMGTFGFILFWLLNAAWVRCGYRTARLTADPFVRRWAILAILVIVSNIVFGKLDMGLYQPRIQIYLGVVLAVLDRLMPANNPKLSRIEADKKRWNR